METSGIGRTEIQGAPAYCRSAICASPPAFPALRGRKNCKSTASRRLRRGCAPAGCSPLCPAAAPTGGNTSRMHSVRVRLPCCTRPRRKHRRRISSRRGLPSAFPCRPMRPPRGLCPIGQRVVRGSRQAPASVGVTGTNGKTTVTAMLCHILRTAGTPCGCIGTLGYQLPAAAGWTDFSRTEPFRPADERAAMTTPEPEELYAVLARMADCAPAGSSPPW